MSNQGYWEKRVAANEAKTQRYAAIAVKRQKKLYKDAYKEISGKIEALALEIMEKGKYGRLTRSELWQFKKYTDLQAYVGSVFEGLTGNQLSLANTLLRQVFEDTMGFTIEALDANSGNIAYSILNENQVNQVLNTSWSGKHYSQRIYDTNSRIGERVKKDITDMIIQGKNTETIKKQLMKDLNVSYSYADRLIRTEASHIFNEAAKMGYKQGNVEEVEVLIEESGNLCDECAELAGKTYRLGTEPRLPLHPNCRCCYAPIVNLSKTQGQD